MTVKKRSEEERKKEQNSKEELAGKFRFDSFISFLSSASLDTGMTHMGLLNVFIVITFF